MGALVASMLGVIVTVGFSKMLVNLSGEVTELKKEANQIGLANKMSGLLSDCQPVLSRSIDANDLQRGEREIIFSELKDKSGSKILDAVGDKEKKMYGLEGHTSFKLSCLDTDCDCSSSQPCSKNWVLSLFTMSYKNNLPMYKEVLNQGLRITYNTSDVADFTCNFGRRLLASPPAPIPTCTRGRTWNGSSCVCPTGQIWDEMRGCNCPLSQSWNGSSCVCPERTIWKRNISTCVCVNNLGWDAEKGECNCTWTGVSSIVLDTVNDICTAHSSREYKKNIVLFEGYEEILGSILKTPLFTYEYKEDYPEKERLGVIAEDLPESLKLPGEPGDPVKPDWVSIQGYLWSGIKALHKELLDLKGFVSVSLELLESSIKKDIKATEESLREELESLKSEQEILKKRFEELEKEKALLKMEVEQYKQKELK